MSVEQNRTALIDARFTPDALAIVERAAELEGESVGDFVVDAAREVANRSIEVNQLIRLSVEGQSRFVDLLLDPPVASPAMDRARAAHARLIRPEL